MSHLLYPCNTFYLRYSKLYSYQADVQDTLSPEYVIKCTVYLGISKVASSKETCEHLFVIWEAAYLVLLASWLGTRGQKT
jgi:hypothetical protein